MKGMKANNDSIDCLKIFKMKYHIMFPQIHKKRPTI